MSSGRGDVRLRVRVVCVAGAAGSVSLRENLVEALRARVPKGACDAKHCWPRASE